MSVWKCDAVDVKYSYQKPMTKKKESRYKAYDFSGSVYFF